MPGTDVNLALDQSDIPAAIADLQKRHTELVDLTAAALTLDADTHHNRTVTVNRAAGSTLTLPAATGSGARFRVLVGTALTSGSLVVQVTGDDVMAGIIAALSDGAAAMLGWKAGATDDTITLNRTTTGVASKGEWLEFEDVAANTWAVRGQISQSGTEATPFSSAVA